ncbi:MAG: hypothetical protein ACRCW3_02760 [Metamycoplasmataceae bacterium]
MKNQALPFKLLLLSGLFDSQQTFLTWQQYIKDATMWIDIGYSKRVAMATD